MSAFDETLNLINGDVGLKLFFLMKSENSENIIKFANLEDGDSDNNTTSELLEKYIELLNNRLVEVSETDIIKLSSADDRVDAVYEYDLEEVPELFAKMRETPISSEDEHQVFNHREDEFSSIKGLIIVIGNVEENIILFKQNYPISLLKRDNFAIFPVPHHNRLERFKKDILKVDINFHFMFVNEKFYIFDLIKLEKLTGFDGIIKKEALKGLEAIERFNLIQDIEPLKDEIEDITFARKLTKIYKDPKVIGKVSRKKIIDFVNKHKFFEEHPIKINKESEQLVIDTKVSKNALLKLLNDDLLYSELTTFEYESVAKNDVIK
ncbi:protein of unknown function [Alkalibacterium putridalgicola]|uniref:DUF4868 domain-containing protein n=1 Tax=Alkalibacterium putridalgicola TaxID=426703 RepID=A0A1H7QQX2_9LACT|nr:anti-phage protein KwaB [Alkalibacterium putridalgicola]GEK88379.1 hypothetical protein APU01nite_04180 [Alkalibacterium putridalgicola]SEL50108.1 protein of unknown function [Alkalibacterium putridalgicola]